MNSGLVRACDQANTTGTIVPGEGGVGERVNALALEAGARGAAVVAALCLVHRSVSGGE